MSIMSFGAYSFASLSYGAASIGGRSAIDSGVTVLPQDDRAIFRQQRWVTFLNNSGEDVPAYGVMRITGLTLLGGVQAVLVIAKPNTTSQPFYLVNGPVRCKAGAYGEGTWLEASGTVKYSSGHPNYGNNWGPTNDDWGLVSGRSGFVMLGEALDTTNKHAYARQLTPETVSYLEYVLNKGIQSWDVSTENASTITGQVGGASKSGWVGSGYRAGSESDVGIQYDSSESTPGTNGNWLVTKAGQFRIVFSGWCYQTNQGASFTYPTGTPHVTTSGPSTPPLDTHTHTVGLYRYDYVADGARLQIDLYRKPSGGAIDTYDDDSPNIRRWACTVPRNPGGGPPLQKIPISFEWNVSFSLNDRLAFKFNWFNNENVTFELYNQLRVRFEYISATAQTWTDI